MNSLIQRLHFLESAEKTITMADPKQSSTPSKSPIISAEANSKAALETKSKVPNFSSGYEFVTIIAGTGESETKFTVHKEFACHYSPVFKAAFNSDFVEGQIQIYKLEHVEGNVVQLLVQWLYIQKFTLEVDLESERAIVLAETGKCSVLATKLWIPADRLIIPELQNQALDWVYEIHDLAIVLPMASLHHAWAHTVVGSPLRRFFVSQLARHPSARHAFVKYPEVYPKNMLLEFAEYCCANMVLKGKKASKESFHVKKMHRQEEQRKEQLRRAARRDTGLEWHNYQIEVQVRQKA